MQVLIKRQPNDEVAIVLIDNPPVNALSTSVAEGLGQAIQTAENDDRVRAIVVMGEGKTFVVGADIKQLEDMAWSQSSGPPRLHKLLLQIEDCTKPVVMAIHGSALGGGLELAMSGHYRVATRDAQVGQPEVNLGIIPGAEGTQRLPRLAGIEKAIEMCVTGKPLKAPDALAAGILDLIVEGDLGAEAVKFARLQADAKRSHPKTRERKATLKVHSSIERAMQTGRELAAKTKRHLLAPSRVVEAIAASISLPFEEGCAVEQRLFEECVTSPQCRALIHVFFAERALSRIPGLENATSMLIKRVGIVGAGTMGSGIAMACANAGLTVLLKDSKPEAIERSVSTILRNYESSIKKGRFTPDEVTQRMDRIIPQVTYKDFETMDLVIEAAFENLELKCSLFRELDPILKTDCILATNTSTLDIDVLSSCTHRRERVLGLHFFSPANVMRLVEIVRGRSTASATVATAVEFAKTLRKIGVVVGNCRGFVGNRMMFPYMYEAQFLVEEGATPKQVDTALKHFGMAMGIFEVDDMAGIDVAWRVRRELGHFSEPGIRKPLVADKLYETGRLGQKTGKGWYRYGQDRKAIPDEDIVGLIRSVAKENGVRQHEFSDEEIIERSLYGMINEGARALDEGYATRASDIDVIYVNGYGFPSWRGGPMFYADSVGLDKIVERISVFEQQQGERWKVAPLLLHLSKTGKTFREFDAVRKD